MSAPSLKTKYQTIGNKKNINKEIANICTGAMKENVHSEIQCNSRVIVMQNKLITTFRERDM